MSRATTPAPVLVVSILLAVSCAAASIRGWRGPSALDLQWPDPAVGLCGVTSSLAAAVTAATAITDGHAPAFFASGRDPPIAAAYSTLSPTMATGPDARYHSRAHQASAALNSAPFRSRRPVRRAVRNPPTSPRAATADGGAADPFLMRPRYRPPLPGCHIVPDHRVRQV